MRKQSESRLYCKTIIYYPSSFTNSCKWLLLKLPTNLLCNGLHVVLPFMQGISEWIGQILRQQQIKVTFKPLKTVNSLFTQLKAQKKVDQATIWQCAKSTAVLYTIGKLNNHLKLGLQNTRELFLCLTTTLDKIFCHVHLKTTTKWILEMSEFLY